ncbi:MAG: NADH-quinone oxidoreductase subunit A [Opitutales bacterium]|nr:NADH-quinone oxidoreductase subunit A [Opitutales bacterium]
MGDASYIPILVQISIAVGLALIILVVSHLFGQRVVGNKIKDSAYECGMNQMQGGIGPRFSIKFYTTAMLFILFDIEVVFLLPWTMIFRDFVSVGIPILMPVLFFMMVLVVGLVYELKKGAIEWDR